MQPVIKKTIQFRDGKVDEKTIVKLLKYEEQTARVIFESVISTLFSLCQCSNVLKKEDPVIKQIENSNKMILEFISLLENALLEIPKGLTTSQLMSNETVICRTNSRNRLKNMTIKGFISILSTLVENIEDLVKLHNNPNILYKDVKIDERDHQILTTVSVGLSDLERKSMTATSCD